MKLTHLTGALAALALWASAAKADVLYLDITGRVTVNGTPQAGVTVEVIPCDGARLPSDWPVPAPLVISGDLDANGHNYHLGFRSGFGYPPEPGPAGSFTFYIDLIQAWFTAVDVALKISPPGCEPVVISCDAIRQAYEATVGTDHLGAAILDIDIQCGAALVPGDTASTGFWANKNGQKLILSLNGGSSSTQLGNWLASSFPYLYGPNAGSRNLTGKSNKQVAALYLQLNGLKGDKVDAQIMAAALAVYVTDSDLAGNAGLAYGFNVSATGTAEKTIDVGLLGSAIGLANNTQYTVLQLLMQANLRKQVGPFNSSAFVVIFKTINETGKRP